MNQFVLYTKPKDREIYWNGKGVIFPEMTGTLPHAATFPTARAAYNAAHAHESMQLFRVGRRPNPVNLRGVSR
jgi:hypothetical protein